MKPLNTADFPTSKDLHHAQLVNLAAMAQSIFHQVGATEEVAQPELTTLVSFNLSDGAFPQGSLIADTRGDLFGTTVAGGANGANLPNSGTVFEIVKTAHGYSSTPTILANFDGANGAQPTAGLIADAQGNLFGTTSIGGAVTPNEPNGAGTVFEIAKTATGYASTPTTLVSFNGANGAGPIGSLIADAQGDLFGTTREGGANSGTPFANGFGTVFEIVKTAHGYPAAPLPWSTSTEPTVHIRKPT